MKFLKWLIVAFLVLSVLLIVPSFIYLKHFLEPANPNSKESSLFYVAEGSALSLVLKKLESQGFIKNSVAGRISLFLKGNKKSLKPGYYKLSKSMSFEEIIEKISSGDVYKVWITIPEGFSINKISKRLGNAGLSERKYKEIAYNLNPSLKDEFYFLEQLKDKSSLEGYLFPDTYDITGGKEEDLIQLQLKRFENQIYNSWEKRPSGWKLTLHETLTLASIVELEAAKASERELIAGVFINRLKLGIPLGSDPTVEYALGWHQDERGLSLNDIKVQSAYNTYKYAGLPPGPIANPGIECFKAVLNYKTTPYLYFVAKGDGSHVFTKTYQEHLNMQKMVLRGLIK